MVFSSILFVGMFLPLVYLVNLFLPLRASNYFLLAASLFLYAWGEPVYVLLLLGCIVVNDILARLISLGRARKVLLVLAVTINLAVLALFKYADFAIESINSLFRIALPLPGIAMPIGISFFTFQALSYVVDVYRGTCQVQKSPSRFALYVSFFPQLIAGPIVKYHEIEVFLEHRRVSLESSTAGLLRFSTGLGKKVLIANALATLVDRLYGMGGANLNAPLAWLAAGGYALQIYFDFSGYSDMAIGMGKMFGFAIPENFNRPYASASIREFWRRWHISLSSWFRDYLYIPLGGNRCGPLRAQLNRMIVFFLTGLWHGASWNFVLWGLGHGALLTLENFGIIPTKYFKGRLRWLGIAYTLVSAISLFVLFRADTLPEAADMFKAMFAGGWNFSITHRTFLADVLTPYMGLVLVVSIVAASLVPEILTKRLDRLGKGTEIVRMLLAVMLLAACVISLVAQTNNPFIYFRF